MQRPGKLNPTIQPPFSSSLSFYPALLLVLLFDSLYCFPSCYYPSVSSFPHPTHPSHAASLRCFPGHLFSRPGGKGSVCDDPLPAPKQSDRLKLHTLSAPLSTASSLNRLWTSETESLSVSSTPGNSPSEGFRPAAGSHRAPPVSFYLQLLGPSVAFQLHGKTFGAAANVPPLHLLLSPLSPDEGKMVISADLFYPLLQSCLSVCGLEFCLLNGSNLTALFYWTYLCSWHEAAQDSYQFSELFFRTYHDLKIVIETYWRTSIMFVLGLNHKAETCIHSNKENREYIRTNGAYETGWCPLVWVSDGEGETKFSRLGFSFLFPLSDWPHPPLSKPSTSL